MIVATLIFLAIACLYVFIVRPVLKTQPAFSEAFKAEASFWEKLQAKLTGWRTKIASRLVMLSGLFVGLYDQALPLITGQDWTSLTSKLPSWALPVGMVLVGLLFNWLHKITENPPVVITQKDDQGEAKVVGVMQPGDLTLPASKTAA